MRGKIAHCFQEDITAALMKKVFRGLISSRWLETAISVAILEDEPPEEPADPPAETEPLPDAAAGGGGGGGGGGGPSMADLLAKIEAMDSSLQQRIGGLEARVQV